MDSFRSSRLRPGVFAGALLIFAAAFSGCSTPVQVTTDNRTLGEYKFGFLVVAPPKPFEEVRDAVKRGFKDLGYFLVQDELDPPGKCELRARTADDTIVIVKLESDGTLTGGPFTNVKIRYGLRGDLAPAQRIYQAIEKNL
ncbi:MAG TPA: DUF3568 family protein [Opitutaceae bacterium]|nr:DUF3568 family protein [Opitutaceae bacterium]